jgi:hypothetical protein
LSVLSVLSPSFPNHRYLRDTPVDPSQYLHLAVLNERQQHLDLLLET